IPGETLSFLPARRRVPACALAFPVTHPATTPAHPARLNRGQSAGPRPNYPPQRIQSWLIASVDPRNFSPRAPTTQWSLTLARPCHESRARAAHVLPNGLLDAHWQRVLPAWCAIAAPPRDDAAPRRATPGTKNRYPPLKPCQSTGQSLRPTPTTADATTTAQTLPPPTTRPPLQARAPKPGCARSKTPAEIPATENPANASITPATTR